MNQIDAIFAQRRQMGEKSLIPFLTAGDPDLATTGRLLEAVQEAGASICELGIAFSDPIADGPVIQQSMSHVLAQGIRPRQVLDLVARLRPRLTMGLVVMVSYTIVYRMGVGSFLRDARDAGIDGFVVPDLPLEESTAVRDAVARYGLMCSFLIAPTTPVERAQRIARASSGFVYLLSRAGLTGESQALPTDLVGRIQAVRSVTQLPIAVGFGISNRQQVHDVLSVADAAIVGSAIMRRVAESRTQGSDAVVDEVGRFIADMAQGLAQGVS